MIKAAIISSLDKCFLDSKLAEFEPIRESYVYRNGILSLQIALTENDFPGTHCRFYKVSVDGIDESAVTFRSVEHMPSYLPAYPTHYDSGYLRTEPGLFPDMLAPLQVNGSAPCLPCRLRTVWVDIDAKGLEDGKHDIIFKLSREGDSCELPFTLTVIPAELPEIDFPVTQWFHYDCLAQYYNVPVFSERHWEIIENFVETYVKCGNNMLLTPVFTPPLDTYVGGERPTVQLVGVKLDSDGNYSFDFSLLTRFMDMADRKGVKYFEISHLFTQWGAKHAPKVMADTPDGYRRIFGWETEAGGEEYTRFLRAFISELLTFLKARGDDKRCVYHISDEPKVEMLDDYMKSKNSIADLLEGYVIMDALSNVDFYRKGVIKNPIPATNHAGAFLEAYAEEGRTGLWVYYCCTQSMYVSNRFFANPGARTRYIGVQFYRYNIGGFLQWGYNYFNNQYSYDAVNPIADTTGNYFVPSGDTCSVYPAQDGTALESMRILQFREGLDDMRALCLAESLVGREKVLETIEPIVRESTGENITFLRCIDRTSDMLRLRKAVDELIIANLK